MTDKDIIRVATGRQSCACEDECDCYPDLIFLVNGRRGYGGGTWAQASPTVQPTYHCRFLGHTFTATHAGQAATSIRQLMAAFNQVEVNP